MSSRNWCFTLNNYTEEEEAAIKAWEVKYIVFGHEVAPETGTPHLQGYVEWKGTKKLTTLKKLNDHIHWEIAKGDRNDNRTYCTKGTDIYEPIKTEKRQGKRNDIEIVKAMVKDGKSAKTIWDAAPSFQAMKMAEIGLKLYEPRRNWKPTVRWYWGPTGSGKTRTAVEEAGDDYWMSGKNLKWWEGYDGHENVIIDDFRADFCTFHELLRILDRYEYRVETKGGSRQLLAKNIWLTSCHPPDKVYQKSDEDVKQLLRRIDVTIYMAQKLDVGAEVEGNTITSTSIDTLEDNIDDNIDDIQLEI